MASFKNLISNTSAQISSGGTITGDLVINGDLQVDGGGTLSFDEIIEGTSQIKVTNTSAFLVEKADGTDVLRVDTTNSDLYITGDLDITGSITNATWTGDVIASAYLDADTAHLSGTQTFSGTKTFSEIIFANKTVEILGQNLSHGASRIKISQENTTKSQIRIYGADSSTAGTLDLVASTSDGSGGGTRLSIDNAGLVSMGGNLTFTHDIATISSTTGLLQFRILETGQDMLFDAGGDFKFRDTDGSNATRVTIQSGTGNIGIGTTTPMASSDGITGLEIGGSATPGLTLKSTGSAQIYSFWADGSGNISLQDNTNDKTRLRVASNGNVSIGGTDTATNLLYIQTDAGDEGITIHSAGNTGNAVVLDANRSGADSGIGTMLGKWNGTLIGYMGFFSGADTTNKDDGVIKFATTPSGGSATVALTIGSDQHATFAQNINLLDDKALTLGTDGDAQIWNDGSNTYIRNNTSDQDIIFRVNDGGATNTEVMRIDGAIASVGIGKTPDTILDIDSGTIGESSAENAGVRITGQRNGNITALTMRHEQASGGATGADNGIGVHFQGYDGSNSYHNMGAIYVRSAENSVSDSDSPGYMTFHTTPNGSEGIEERMRIDSTGLVGISGTSNTTYNALNLKNSHGNGSSKGTVDITGDVVNSVGQTSRGRIQFRETTNDSSKSEIAFFTSDNTTLEPVERLLISSTGIVYLTAGLNFPDTQSASTDANTLDDYEEGDWTPVLSDGSNNATSDGNTAGSYTKIGRKVTVTGRIATSSLGSVSGALRITGLPFASGNGDKYKSVGNMGLGLNLNVTAGYNIDGYIGTNVQYILLYINDAATGATAMTGAEWSADGHVIIQATYFT